MLDNLIILAKELYYTGGNNGNQFADFLHENNMLHDGLSCDDYFLIAKVIPYQHQNYIGWILLDNFWEDFCYRVEIELKIKLRC